jgi:cyclopropane fatty-acyl-phospholipid synthase-like methyltransferase
MTTIDIYNNNAANFIERYDNAEMSSLHKLLLDQIQKNTAVLDIGFGSGRDLQFLKDNSYDIWGIDPSEKFVQNAQDRFQDISNHFICSAVPFPLEKPLFSVKFDAIITIAMWMHLKREQYKDVVKSMVSVAKDKATIIISYSEGNRPDDERYFEEIDLEYIIQIFKQYNFTLLKTITNKDSLKRESLTWVTVIFKHD